MFNPSYLIRSRHAIYYFRYPLPTHGRVSVSLKTRCPKIARRLANALEYYSLKLLKQIDISGMKHSEIVELFKSYYAVRLEKLKGIIDEEGSLNKGFVKYLGAKPAELEQLINSDENDIDVSMGAELLNIEDTQAYQEVKRMMDFHGLEMDIDSADYAKAEKEWKHAYLAFTEGALKLQNQDKYNFTGTTLHISSNTAKHKLGDVINAYLKYKEKYINANTLETNKQQLGYLIELLGYDFNIVTFTNDGGKTLRDVRECISNTPTNRAKIAGIRDKTLREQIRLAQELGLSVISAATYNKYIGYFSSLFNWAISEQYLDKNPFEKAKIKTKTNKSDKREEITKDEITIILNALEQYKDTHPCQYWGTLISLYTGARRNEVCSLLPSDIKQDRETSIYYFDIADEQEQGKGLKTGNAVRIVPIHNDLIELGLLEFIQSSIEYAKKKPKQGNYDTRLLYDFTHTQGNGWGRKLSQFVNDRLFKEIGIKSNTKVLHSLRHSFISNLNRAEVEMSIIQSMAGHEQSTVTTKVYTHYGIEHLEQFKKAIDKLSYR
jgi:integrase